MKPLEVYTLGETDDNITQLCDVLAIGLRVALDAELVSPETWTALHKFINTERGRIAGPQDTQDLRDPFAEFRHSKHWAFWSSLCPGSVVRWTKTKQAVYTCVTGDILDRPTGDNPHDRTRPVSGWIELRRSTGKTFFAHISHVRPAPGTIATDPIHSHSHTHEVFT